MDEFAMSWVLGGVGSARCTFSAARDFLTMGTTYVGDGLSGLVRCMLALKDGATTSRFVLPGEPTHYLGDLHVSGDDVDLVVTRFRYEDDLIAERDGEEAWRKRFRLAQLLAAVGMGLAAVLEEHGAAGYLARWAPYSFPEDELRALIA